MKHEKSCGCIIIEDKKVLLIKQTNGIWGFPKGHVEKNETELQTAEREVKEETGLDITGCRYLFSIPNLYPYCGFEVHTVDMFFECLTESFDRAKAEDDAAEIIILPTNQLNPDDFGLQSIKKAVDRYIK